MQITYNELELVLEKGQIHLDDIMKHNVINGDIKTDYT